MERVKVLHTVWLRYGVGYLPTERSGRRAVRGWRLGQGEEEPLHAGNIRLIERAAGPGVETLAHPGGNDLEPGAVQGLAGRRELRDDVLAVAAFLDHPGDTAQLPFDATQSLQQILGDVRFDLHRDRRRNRNRDGRGSRGGQSHLAFFGTRAMTAST